MALLLLSPNGQAYAEVRHTVGRDEAAMALIAEGPFLRGSVEGQGDADERPQRTIHLKAFWIDREEVTNRQYQAFLKATKHRVPEHCCDSGYNIWKGTEIESRLLDHPVVNVDWYDAEAYCKWVGKRLPTEAEWEKAAGGPDGRQYPWGNEGNRMKANGAAYWAGKDFPTQEEAKAFWGEAGAEVLEKHGFHGMLTLPETALPEGATPTGLRHLSSNVWEWVADWYGADYDASAPEHDPMGPEAGEYKVLKGGS